ncbi:MAG: hypothetical protein HY906_20255 [Deltaproteobacteria bacterium]|nr:hypothetical protein [Deltaproteobacteria bacterium]
MRRGLGFLLCGALVAAGCQPTTYVVSRSSLENVRRLPPPKRGAAVVEGWTKAGRRPVQIRYRALRLDDASLNQILTRDFTLLRVEASPMNPAVVGGLVTMGVGAALLGLGWGILRTSDRRDELDSGVFAWLGLVIAGSVHIGVGGIVAIAGAARPLIEPINTGLNEPRPAGPAAKASSSRGAGLVLRF